MNNQNNRRDERERMREKREKILREIVSIIEGKSLQSIHPYVLEFPLSYLY